MSWRRVPRRGGVGAAVVIVVIVAAILIGDPPSNDTGGPGGPTTAAPGSAPPTAPGPSPAGSGPARGTLALVTDVVDGDTIAVRLRGREDRVRYIGVDTPESVKPGSPVECFARRASRFNSRLVEGKRVRLVFDRERRDRYGRLLAYVYVGPRFVNAELLRQGYARTLTIAPNDSRAALFERLELRAGRQGRGLWGRCEA